LKTRPRDIFVITKMLIFLLQNRVLTKYPFQLLVKLCAMKLVVLTRYSLNGRQVGVHPSHHSLKDRQVGANPSRYSLKGRQVGAHPSRCSLMAKNLLTKKWQMSSLKLWKIFYGA